MSATTTSVVAPDGVSLLVRTWSPSGERRAEVVVVHGLGEHGGRYLHVGEHLTGAGFEVRAPDLRGFGRSGGRRAYVDRFERFLDDTALLVAHRSDPGLPLVMIGQSMGGLIALSYALSERPGPDLLVLSAPAVDADIPASKRLAARLLGGVAPRLAIPNAIEGGQLSRDPSVGEAYLADPLVQTKTTTGLGRELLAAMDEAGSRMSTLAVPTLVIHGGGDTLVPTALSEPLGALGCVERIVFPDFRHEPFNEEGGAAALSAVVSWIEAHL